MKVIRDKNMNFIKYVIGALVAILFFGAGIFFVFKNYIQVSAKQDTLPGIVKLQNQYLNTGEVFKVLEIQSTLENAEIGFYIGGQEPFASLINPDGTRANWQECLATMENIEDRMAFMNTLEVEARTALETIGDGIFAVPNPFYEEVEASSISDAISRGYSYIEFPGEQFRGYFVETPGAGEWLVSFAGLENTNIPVDDVNYGKDIPYYRAFYDENSPFTKETLENLTQNAPDTYLYQLINEELVFAGTAVSIWDAVREIEGDIPAYYSPTFALINGVESNFVSNGDHVYIVSPRNATKVENGGNYTLVSTLEGEQAGANYSTPSTYVYYRGGVQNSEFFKNKVLGLDVSDYNGFKVQVTTLTLDALNQMSVENIAAFDMVYVGGKGSYATDINNNAMNALADLVVTRKVPCIIDGALILANNEVGVWYSFSADRITNFEKLVAMFVSPSKNKVYGDGRWSDEYLRLSNARELERLLPISDISEIDGNQFATGKIEEDDYGAMNTHDGAYVLRNIWLYSSQNTSFVRTDFGQEDYVESSKILGGFQAVLKELQSENKIRNQYARPLLDEGIHDFSVWRYILNYQNQREEVIKNKLRVLKIEPATNSDAIIVGNHKTTMKEYLSDVTGVNPENITVDAMPITQFIGMIDDLNTTYDMIYIGSLMDNLHTNTAKTSTVYNDSNMNGLLYSHVGDLMLETFHISGLLETDFTKNGGRDVLRMNTLHRYSGNDITPEKFNAFMDFLDAGYPVVLAADLLQTDGNGECIRVDDSSYLYEFLDMTREKANVLTIDEIQSADSDFPFYLNRPKMEITNLRVLNAGDFPTNTEVKVLDKVGGVYTLSLNFVIDNDGAVSPNDLYQGKLYFDANADGKFSTINEEVLGITIKDGAGNVVNRNQLLADQLYYLECVVSDNYRGCMTWKLGIEQVNNAMIRTDQIGYVKINSLEEQPVRISILQVYFHDSMEANLILENAIGPVEYDSNTKHYKYRSPNGIGHFGTYSRGMENEYILDVTSISRAEFETFVRTGRINHNGRQITSLDDYDMLIVGFSDAFDIYYSSVDWSEAAAKKIVEFAETGKSVLLSHDTTSLITVPTEYMDIRNRVYRTEQGDRYIDDSVWGYAFNKYVRNTLAMDMFEVTSSEVLQKGAPLIDYRQDSDPSNDYLTEDWLARNAFKADPVTERYVYYDFADLAYEPRSNRTKTVPQTQGLAYTLMNKRTANSNLLFYRDGLVQSSDHYSQNVSKINEGQITNYPYKIEDNFNVGRTHSQYYTLNLSSDMNEDMQTDLVVWYTLEGNNYDSVKDVRNNYYIYSVGNVMYTGMGHGSSTQSARLTDMEAKLFMNTIIASYKAGIQSPNVNLDGGSADAYIYNFMETSMDENFNEPVEIEYAFRDLNVHSGTKEIEVEYYVEDAVNGTIMSGMNGKVSKVLDGETYTSSGELVADLTKLKPGESYTIRLSGNYFRPNEENGNEIMFYIRIRTKLTTKAFNGKEKTTYTSWGIGRVNYLNCELMELD